jgi:hypothetical protein
MSTRLRPWIRRTAHSFALAAIVCGPLAPAAAPNDAIDVAVHRDGEAILIDVFLRAPVSQQEAWDVLTDFDRMASIVGNLEFSRVLEREGNRVVVAQRGGRTEGLLRFSFETVREVELHPTSLMRARLIRGNIARLEGTTALMPSGEATQIVSHGLCVPGRWVPPVLGELFIENATREQYADLRREMLKRHRASRE